MDAVTGLVALGSVLPGFALKSTLVLAGAWAADRCCGRVSASSRHLLWAASLAGVLVLLLAELLLPAWTLPLLPSSSSSAPSGAALGVFSPGTALAACWLVFAALGLLRVAAGWIGVARLRSRAVAFDDPGLLADAREVAARLGIENGNFHICRVSGLPGPCVAGLLRPLVILPEDSPRWDAERRRLVLCHELAHLARRDLFWQALAQVAVAAASFQPLAWLAWRRLREESEKACDDQVLRLGGKASSYATALLMSTRVSRTSRPLLAAALGEKSELESRLLAVLAPGVRREAQGRRERALAVLGLVALLPLASLKAGNAPAARLPSAPVADKAEVSPPSPPDPLAAEAAADPVAPPSEPSLP